MKVKFIDAGGIRTRYIEAGDGEPLILLHGVGLSADTFIFNVDEIGKHCRVIALDMLGHGFTDAQDYGDEAPHGFLVKHVAAFADSLGLEKFAIGGSSFGAQIATLLYLEMPQRVSRLIIIGSGSSFNTEEEQSRTLKAVYENAMTAIKDPTWESCVARLGNICFDPASVPKEIILSQLTSYARPEIRIAYEATLRGMTDLEKARPHRILERLEEISVPTLIIWGRQDIRGRHDRAVEAERRIADAALVTLEECGHLPYLEKPKAFNDAIIQFLRER